MENCLWEQAGAVGVSHLGEGKAPWKPFCGLSDVGVGFKETDKILAGLVVIG